jgi:DNA-binding transcriptional MerR regulator
MTERGLRIGEVAELTGTTPRTIRYYEEIGLLPSPAARETGRHRTYTPEDVDRLKELLRLRELLGVSLDELKELRFLDRQLELVRHRRDEIAKLEAELVARRRRVRTRQRELERGRTGARS